MEQAFLKRAVELLQEIQKSGTLKEAEQKAHQLEGYLMGAMEIFAVMEKLNGKDTR